MIFQIDLVVLFFSMTAAASGGFLFGMYTAERKTAKVLKERGRCLLAGDLYHVMLVNGEIPE